MRVKFTTFLHVQLCGTVVYKYGRRAEVDERDGMRERERKEEEDGEKKKLE